MNYIRPSMALCVVWSQFAHEKMKTHKKMFARKAKELYMTGEDPEMEALMQDFYAGKYKNAYKASPWSKPK